ncbi:MAG: hybrid-cluster NAD(P)-dependent oxidoreductase [Oceanospirillaceae bacterium]|nr:hybrid-cluster NAD(P)-dependent oxidoreductase [Oceanospirillaceae bacterium]MBT6077309.1 hybrid-cluster NAD(P)-dependent oxidoreductase [Oceanospirillaceae bacterium]
MAPEQTADSKYFEYLNQSIPWRDQSQLLEVVSIVPEVADVMTITFRTENNAYFNFAPGQFITLELSVNGENLYRTYTISSSPSRPYSLSITVKAQPNSIGTRWMLDHLNPGMKVRAFGPSGQFHLYHHPAEKYCFISAGSGITPMASMTNFLYDRGGDMDVSFIHCARRPSEIIFKRSLEQMAARVPGIHLAWIVQDKDPFSAWTGYVGRFNQLILELTTPDFFDREVFCCGPEPFMQAVRDVLIAADFNMAQYHEESFAAPNFEDDDIEHDDVQLDDAVATKVHFLVSGHQLDSNQNITVLESANQAGLNIPSACNFGVCGTCKVKKVSGETHMVHNGGISDADIEAGYILACCSKPITDVAISY